MQVAPYETATHLILVNRLEGVQGPLLGSRSLHLPRAGKEFRDENDVRVQEFLEAFCDECIPDIAGDFMMVGVEAALNYNEHSFSPGALRREMGIDASYTPSHAYGIVSVQSDLPFTPFDPRRLIESPMLGEGTKVLVPGGGRIRQWGGMFITSLSDIVAFDLNCLLERDAEQDLYCRGMLYAMARRAS